MINLHNTLFGKTISVLLCWAVLTGSLPIQQLRAAKVQQDSSSLSLPVTTNFEYDGSGNVVARVDGNGNRTEYEYDKINRLKSIDYPGGDGPEVRFTYDGNGNLTSMTDWTGTTRYTYDVFDHLTAVDYPDGNVIMYGYDLVGNIAWVACGTRSEEGVVCEYTPIDEIGLCAYHFVSYEYDPDNRISSATDGLIGETTSYAYDEAGNLARCDLSNGCYTRYGYDDDGRLTAVEHYNASSEHIAKYEYTLNSIGNHIQMVETTPAGSKKMTDYTYDVLDRLDKVSYPDERTVDYDYDSFGNRKTMKEMRGNTMTVTEYFYDSDSRLLYTKVNGIEDEQFSYDAIGNLIRRTNPGESKQKDYTYDHENRLIRYNDGTNDVTYAYDGLGYRVAKTVNGQRIGFLNDINRRYVEAIAEFDASGEPTRMRIWGNDLVSVRGHYVGTLHYYLHDAPAGSVSHVLNPTGQTVNNYEYDAFGMPSNETEGVDNSYQFHGEVLEEETGLVFLRARYYDSNMGRFLTRDPFSGFQEHPSSLNPYAFVANNPVNFSDPSGLLYNDDTLYLYIRNPFRYRPTKPGLAGFIERITPHTGLGDRDSMWGYWPNGVVQESVKGYDPYPIPFASYSRSIQAIQADMHLWPGSAYSLALPFSGPIGWMFWKFCWTHSATHIRLNDAAAPDPNVVRFMMEKWWREMEERNRSYYPPFPPGGGGGAAVALGGVDLNRVAEVLLDISDIKGVTYDTKTGQLIIYGEHDASLPAMNLDDLAVAARVVDQGLTPVLSIEDPCVPCENNGCNDSWCYTVRYEPEDVISNTHFGSVMFEADRVLKSLGLGRDNATCETVTSRVSGFRTMWERWSKVPFEEAHSARFWFQPSSIKLIPSPDGKSMVFAEANMEVVTESTYTSTGEVIDDPDAVEHARHFTEHYDEFAEEFPIFGELKQLAKIYGVVRWLKENEIASDLSFLLKHEPAFVETPAITPRTVVEYENQISGAPMGIVGGVVFDKELEYDAPSVGPEDAVVAARSSNSPLAWTADVDGTTYNAVALSLEKKPMDGGFAWSNTDLTAEINCAVPLALTRHYDSLDVEQGAFGWGWRATPYALQFKGVPVEEPSASGPLEVYGKINFVARTAQAVYEYEPDYFYNTDVDVFRVVHKFGAGKDILVYVHESKDLPGLLFSDGGDRYVMRLANGALLNFNAQGQLRDIEDRNGNQIVYGYDAANRLISVSQSSCGRAIRLSYDAKGRVIRATSPAGRIVRYSYDSRDNLTNAKLDSADGWELQYAYDTYHNLTEIRSGDGQLWFTREYDVYGRATSVTQPSATAAFASEYDWAEGTTQTTGPEGFSEFRAYDEDYNLTHYVDARENSSELGYNSRQSLTTLTDAEGYAWNFYYDQYGYPEAVLWPSGRMDALVHDHRGYPIQSFQTVVGSGYAENFDEEHIFVGGPGYVIYNWTDYKYDDAGNLKKIIDAYSNEHDFEYDTRGNLSRFVDARGFDTQYKYDDYSRVVEVANEKGHAVLLDYDSRDNLTIVKTEAGTVEMAYDAQDRLHSMIYGDPQERRSYVYGYNVNGQLKSVTSPDGTVTSYVYDESGNLIQVIHDGVVLFEYEYDDLNRIIQIRYSGTVSTGEIS